MRGRLYDSRIGRFLQADPPFMESPLWSQGLNPYSYVFNNPLTLADPSGFVTDDGETSDVTDSDQVIWDDTCDNSQGGCGGDEASADGGAMTIGVEILTADSPDSIEDVSPETEAADGEDAQSDDQEELD